MNYKFKFRSHPVPTTEQEYTIPRADCEIYLKMLNKKSRLHDGEKRLQTILSEALKQPNWKGLILKLKKSAQSAVANK